VKSTKKPKTIEPKIKKEPFSQKQYYESHKDKFKNYYEIRKEKIKTDAEINKIVYDAARENHKISLKLGLPFELINFITAKKAINKNLSYTIKYENDKIILSEKKHLTKNDLIKINKYDSDTEKEICTGSNFTTPRSDFYYCDIYQDNIDTISHYSI